MTTRSLSFSSLRALASARRRDLAGSWSNIADRDLHRTASDLLAAAYDDGAWAGHRAHSPVARIAEPVAAPVDLEARRNAKSATPVTSPATPAPRPAASHARAS
jgi:hypothetical protein